METAQLVREVVGSLELLRTRLQYHSPSLNVTLESRAHAPKHAGRRVLPRAYRLFCLINSKPKMHTSTLRLLRALVLPGVDTDAQAQR
jgi:hypothetical protein